MDKRFNPDCNTFEEIVSYFKMRAIQLLRFGFKLESIYEEKWGGYAIFTNEKEDLFYSPYIALDCRGLGLYEQFMYEHKYPTIITSDDCGIDGYLEYKGFPYVKVLAYNDYYRLISDYYGDRKAERSGIPYINHIDEGLALLKWLGLSMEAHEHIFAAYAYHPILQMDDDLVSNTTRLALHHDSVIARMSREAIIYTMEYRSVANEYLSKRSIQSIEEIRLSPLRQVNWMLMADKIQNRKDFELYHEGTHPRSKELAQYFRNWLQRLNISEEKYQIYKKMLIVDPQIVHL